MTNPVNIPFLSVCMIVRNDIKTVETTLKSVRARAPGAEIVVVDTMSSDGTLDITRRYADVVDVWAGPDGKWTKEMPWFDDAAAARQRSFELAHGRWRMWIDADDELVGTEEMNRILALAGDKADRIDMALEDQLRNLEAERPDIHMYWAPYVYESHPDGTPKLYHPRERIVKWDVGWKWYGAAHEYLDRADRQATPTAAGFIGNLLYVHRKIPSPEAEKYSTQRHWAVLNKVYDSGNATSRDCHYLAICAEKLGVQRVREFLREAIARAVTPIEKARANLEYGMWLTKIKQLPSADQFFTAARESCPDLVDVWYTSAEYESFRNNWHAAVEYFEHVLEMPLNDMQSLIGPYERRIKMPLQLARARAALAGAEIASAVHGLQRAAEIANVIAADPACKTPDEARQLAEFCRKNFEMLTEPQPDEQPPKAA